MESIGIDVQKVNSQTCVVGENAEVLEERRIQKDRERFGGVSAFSSNFAFTLLASTGLRDCVREKCSRFFVPSRRDQLLLTTSSLAACCCMKNSSSSRLQ
jgi:hypothetical protein